MKGCMFIRVISTPWNSDRPIAIAAQASIASNGLKPHSVSIIESSTPSKAIIEPTERSIPPVMITRPRPMLKMPKAPICRARFCRLIDWRKLGLIIATMTQRATRRMKIPSSFFISVSLLRACRQTHHCLFAELRALKGTRDFSFMHDGDAIADAQHFFHLTANGDDRNALPGEFTHQRVNLGLCTDVNPAGGLVKNQ